MTLLRVHDLGKAYRKYASEWHRFAGWLGVPTKPIAETWVLRHVSFEVGAGEAIGIVGQNGAGKSTLLKLVTGTIVPTEGSVSLAGDVAAILELGMGFNAELTGRQNVIHSAGLLGFSGSEIEQYLPDIESFAEIGEYFDKPLRTCSSGMQMRVAFALATARRPGILIVDEALSVGDAYFQHKSFQKIRQFQEQGTTLLIVSHDRSSIQALCTRAILLEQGSVIYDGEPEAVMDFYNALIAEKENATVEVSTLDDGRVSTRSGTGEARVEQIYLANTEGDPIEFVEVGQAVTLHIRVKVHSDLETLVLGYGIKDRLGQVLYGTNTWHTKQVLEQLRAGSTYNFEISFNADFGVGSYSIQTALVDQDTHLTANYEWTDIALLFNVMNTSRPLFVGCLWNEPTIQIEEVA